MSDALLFPYKGCPQTITLPKGRYKLEVWGAKGGDSTGRGTGSRANQSSVRGGLGGYSQGILNLTKDETIQIYVGEEGRSSNPSDGCVTSGGFPDGGGTKTGHCNSNYSTVPGTGGGSTSIRIRNNLVILAGGGGGASGSSTYADQGGYGGGQTGGNCYYRGSIQRQGAGTQSGSTQGLGEIQGDPGQFGSGASGKYSQGCDSGGGGGGGWYGGGSGGYGNNGLCSSGGGGSGWVLPYIASSFMLNITYDLSDSKCLGGNEEFPTPDGKGTERGHAGSGFAKITPL